MLESSLPSTTIAPRHSHINKSWQNAAGMPSYQNPVVSWQGLTGCPYHHFAIGLSYRETADSPLFKQA